MQVIGNQETAKGWQPVANSRNGVPRCAKSVTNEFANFGNLDLKWWGGCKPNSRNERGDKALKADPGFLQMVDAISN